jgi:protein arginine kinase activator
VWFLLEADAVLCEVCKENDVAITLTEIDGNGVRQVRLCEKCAAERGVQTAVATPKPALESLLQSAQQQLAGAQDDVGRCSFCASTLRDFRQSGRLGCPYCYTAFEASLRDLLRKVQGSARHTGREYGAPPTLGTAPTGAPTADRLRERLERAIRNEEFELAATIRDQLRALE